MASMVCDIVTPAEAQFSEECYMVAVPGTDGHMGFLPGHAPLVSTLSDGEVRVFSDANTLSHRFACQGGYVQVSSEKVIILADRAIPAEEIDAAEVSAKIEQLQAELDKLPEDSMDRNVVAYDLRWYKTLEQVAAGK